MDGLGTIIERAIRKRVTDGGCSRRLREERVEATRLLDEARSLDERLERAEAARVVAEAERDDAIFELERIFHFVPALLIFKKLDGTLLRVNEATARGFGLTPSDMVGKNQSDFWPPEQVARFRADDEEIMRTREGKYGYLEPVQWGGETHDFRTWKIPIYNGEPAPIGIMLFAIDITVVGDLSVEVLGK